ncbi:hypothetical protein FRX31_004066, partial [Thalictrum thalictroides]
MNLSRSTAKKMDSRIFLMRDQQPYYQYQEQQQPYHQSYYQQPDYTNAYQQQPQSQFTQNDSAPIQPRGISATLMLLKIKTSTCRTEEVVEKAREIEEITVQGRKTGRVLQVKMTARLG